MKAAFLHFAGWRSRGTRTSQSYRSGARTTHTTVTLEARNGWHWKEWLAEGAGTAILLFAVVTAKDLAVRAGPPLRSGCVSRRLGLPRRSVAGSRSGCRRAEGQRKAACHRQAPP
jgi:hypothetical protein